MSLRVDEMSERCRGKALLGHLLLGRFISFRVGPSEEIGAGGAKYIAD
jgi:hypothetical protein